MRELWYIIKVSAGRMLGCMVLCWLLYNPWFSLTTWLWPQVVNTDELHYGWPIKVLIVLLAFGFLIGMVLTVRSALGWGWSLLVISVAALLAYLPFYISWPFSTPWVEATQRHVFYAAYFFVVPALFGAALSAGYVTRYLKGTLLTQSVGGHVDANVHSTHPGATDQAHHAP
jgi:hypothetical protein